MDTYADDLAALVETLDLKKAIHVGHSTGGGEVARYIGRHGTTRVAKAALIGAIPPLMLKTPPTLAARRWRCSTAFAPPSSPTGRSSSRI
jgi:pimeloyl-ACP methyl ester carboxylesterase